MQAAEKRDFFAEKPLLTGSTAFKQRGFRAKSASIVT
jgi:hypothetical protein